MPTKTTTNEVAVPDDSTQVASFQQQVRAFEQQFAAFRQMPLGLVKAAMAQEGIQAVKEYVKGPEAYLRPDIQKADQLHKSLLKKLNDLRRIPQLFEDYCYSVLREWKVKETARIEAEKREQERQAQLEAQKQREEELAHLQAQNVPTEIIEQRAADPIIVAVPDVDEHRGKVEGTSTVDRWTGEVTDMAGFVTILATRPGLVSLLLEVVQNELNKYLTRTKGSDDFGGTVKVSYDPIVRSKAS